ncbi:MAG: hypothetical protein WA771_06485 [Chthoniobacterales bacterium]
MRILVTGLIGNYAFGGVTWDYIQYVLGFRELGHDVWYLEDTATWAYDPVAEEPSADCLHNVNYLERVMHEFDLGDRWIYRNEADGKYHGPAGERSEEVIRDADVLINVSGACWLRECTAGIPRKLFVDGDPMFTHIGLTNLDRQGYIDHLRAHEEHHTFGLNVGRTGCKVPTAGFEWQPTVQPIALDWWQKNLCPPTATHVARDAWTTVMNWASYPPQEFEGNTYGNKDIEFLRFIDLPGRTSEKFVLAMGQGVGRSRPTERIEGAGWQIIEPDVHLPDYATYHDFLANSKAEWSIAKNGYVKSHSGWFSCRSACYLAMGKPVVVQDTGWTEHLPAGEGILSFTTLEESVGAIEKITADYERHCVAARKFAEKHLDAKKVCAALLE